MPGRTIQTEHFQKSARVASDTIDHTWDRCLPKPTTAAHSHPTECLAGSLTGPLTDWLAGCLAHSQMSEMVA